MSDDPYLTRQTLLQRAQNQDDQQAWDEFVNFYRKFIFHILNKMNFNTQDADDLAQEILLKLWRKLASYDKQKSKFRTWLKQVTRNTALDYLRQVKRKPRFVELEAEYLELNAYLNSMSDSQFEEIFESEWRAYLCEKALENVDKLFSGTAVQAFKLSRQGVSTEEIAKRLELKKHSVYVLICRVRARFVNELRRLINEQDL